MESRRRSLAKALSYRLGGLVITGAVAWGITGQLRFAAAIGTVDALFKIALYYAHERVWTRLSFGRPRPPEYQI